MGFLRSKVGSEFGPFAALLLALVLSITLVPFVDEGGFGDKLVRLGFAVVLIAGLGIARENRGLLGIALVMLAANLIVGWLAHWITGDPVQREVLRSAFGAAYLVYLIVLLIRTLSRQTEASLDIVLGGINVYLLLAMAFMFMHLALEQLTPGSYQRGGLLLSDPVNVSHGSLSTTMFYFSFTTLTTLGYGDVSPVRPVAEFLCSAEAVIGQLYVAIFIGGLVALRISGKRRASSEPID